MPKSTSSHSYNYVIIRCVFIVFCLFNVDSVLLSRRTHDRQSECALNSRLRGGAVGVKLYGAKTQHALFTVSGQSGGYRPRVPTGIRIGSSAATSEAMPSRPDAIGRFARRKTSHDQDPGAERFGGFPWSWGGSSTLNRSESSPWLERSDGPDPCM